MTGTVNEPLTPDPTPMVVDGDELVTAAARMHKVRLGYTTADDGIWLRCSCGWRRHLGYDPTVEEAGSWAEAHRRSRRG